MKVQRFKQESIEVPKEIIDDMIKDFEKLLKGFEKISEQESMRRVDKRLKDVKEGKIKGLSEKDYIKFVRRKGINA